MIEVLPDSRGHWPSIGWNVLETPHRGTMAMLVAGFMGEAGYINSMVGFVIGMLGWFHILYEIFAGDAGKQAGQASAAVQSAFGNMRLVVTIGWAIYLSRLCARLFRYGRRFWCNNRSS